MADDEMWSVATAEDNGLPVLFRIRAAPPPFAQQEQFPVLLAVSWPYEPADPHGMPSPEEHARMSELEDLLADAFEGAEQAFLTVIATGNGVREWQWYSRDPEQTMELVNQTLGELEPFPIEFSMQEDPEWSAYERFRDIGDE